jgi:hypothetical protein
MSYVISENIYRDVWKNSKFDGKIVETMKWHTKDNYENYLKNGNKKYGVDDIIYEINEYDYRTNSLINDKKTDNVIACFGCSHTFGAGLPWEETWPAVLNEKLGSDWVVKNYALCGAANDNIARLIYNYTLEHNPKYICVFLPDVLRMELYDYNLEHFNNFLPTDNDEVDKYDAEKLKYYDSYRTIAVDENGIYNFIKNFKFIDMVCKEKNIPWFWCTWSDLIVLSSKRFRDDFLRSDNYINLSDFETFLDVARDGRHFGKNTCKTIAERFYNKIKL